MNGTDEKIWKSVGFTKELEQEIREIAKAEKRSFAAQVLIFSELGLEKVKGNSKAPSAK
jgi:hypothetical protein